MNYESPELETRCDWIEFKISTFKTFNEPFYCLFLLSAFCFQPELNINIIRLLFSACDMLETFNKLFFFTLLIYLIMILARKWKHEKKFCAKFCFSLLAFLHLKAFFFWFFRGNFPKLGRFLLVYYFFFVGNKINGLMDLGQSRNSVQVMFKWAIKWNLSLG